MTTKNSGTMKDKNRARAGKSCATAFLEGISDGPLTLAKMLRSIREGEGLTQVEFSQLLSISKQHLSHIENGRKVVSPERAARWAGMLGYGEAQFVRLAIQDDLRRSGLSYSVSIEAA